MKEFQSWCVLQTYTEFVLVVITIAPDDVVSVLQFGKFLLHPVGIIKRQALQSLLGDRRYNAFVTVYVPFQFLVK